MIKIILFDLDDTILDFHKAEASALSAVLRQLGIEPLESTLARYSEINAAQWRLLEAGELTREQLLTRRFDLLFEELGVKASSKMAQSIYENSLMDEYFFIDGAQELLEYLHQKYDLYIVSNGNLIVQQGRIASAGIAKYFKNVFISEFAGYDKPQKEYFDYCFVRIPNFSREETMIIGDSLTSDIQGGINAGIHTCWFNPRRKPAREDIPAEYEVRELGDIPGLLARL